MKVFLTIIFTVLLLISAPAFADEYKKDDGAQIRDQIPNMEEVMALSQPGSSHEIFAKMAGNWDYTITYKMMQDAPEQTSTGKAKNEVILDGRFLKQAVEGPMDMGGQMVNYKGEGILGYDNRKETYQSVWFDNMNTSMMVSSGSFNPKTKTLTENGTHYCPMRGKDVNFKAELKIQDDNHMTYTMYDTDTSGNTYKMMEIKYTRI